MANLTTGGRAWLQSHHTKKQFVQSSAKCLVAKGPPLKWQFIYHKQTGRCDYCLCICFSVCVQAQGKVCVYILLLKTVAQSGLNTCQHFKGRVIGQSNTKHFRVFFFFFLSLKSFFHIYLDFLTDHYAITSAAAEYFLLYLIHPAPHM